MPVTFDAAEFDSALRQFKDTRAAAKPGLKTGAERAAGERDAGEAFKVRIISARTKLKLMRDRSDALRDSLQRFRMQQHGANRA